MTDPFSSRQPVARPIRQAPRLWATTAIIAINAAVFLGMVASGVSFMSPGTADLVRWGANWAGLSFGGEPWRLFTCMFVHIGIVHIGMNMYVLWNIGRFVERILGATAYLAVYGLAGLAGSILSACLHPNVVSAGASGAIFGLYGFLLGFLLRHRNVIARPAALSLGKSAGMFVLYNLIFGIAVPGIDLSAHFGGLAGGFLLGLLFPAPRWLRS